MKAVARLVEPVAKLLPAWFPGETLLSFLLVLVICFLIGAAVRTRRGRAAREQVEKSLFERMPGYALFRGLTQQLAGKREEETWKPALAQLEHSLVPAFVIEEFDDGRFTVFLPDAPAPFSGSVHILPPERVHMVDIPFTHAVKLLSRWGSGSKELVLAMKDKKVA
jgi:uncharacterized membrane protein